MTVYVLLLKKKGVQNDCVTVALQESTPSYIQELEYRATGYYGNTQPVGLHVLIKTRRGHMVTPQPQRLYMCWIKSTYIAEFLASLYVGYSLPMTSGSQAQKS